ncbi:hypothetical protein ACFL1B_02415 [Nanoarchaeota archaeon]
MDPDNLEGKVRRSRVPFLGTLMVAGAAVLGGLVTPENAEAQDVKRYMGGTQVPVKITPKGQPFAKSPLSAPVKLPLSAPAGAPLPPQVVPQETPIEELPEAYGNMPHLYATLLAVPDNFVTNVGDIEFSSIEMGLNDIIDVRPKGGLDLPLDLIIYNMDTGQWVLDREYLIDPRLNPGDNSCLDDPNDPSTARQPSRMIFPSQFSPGDWKDIAPGEYRIYVADEGNNQCEPVAMRYFTLRINPPESWAVMQREGETEPEDVRQPSEWIAAGKVDPQAQQYGPQKSTQPIQAQEGLVEWQPEGGWTTDRSGQYVPIQPQGQPQQVPQQQVAAQEGLGGMDPKEWMTRTEPGGQRRLPGPQQYAPPHEELIDAYRQAERAIESVLEREVLNPPRYFNVTPVQWDVPQRPWEVDHIMRSMRPPRCFARVPRMYRQRFAPVVMSRAPNYCARF